jgi:starch phosphorylase
MDGGVIAYFSMEIAVDPAMPTYSGGLGVLAGDTARAAADLQVPMVAVTLLHRKGYFRQSFDSSGWQRESPAEWPVGRFLRERPERVSVVLERRVVHLRAWERELVGITGSKVRVYFLDADLPENASWDRTLTDYLYGGDAYYRICQEVLLGIGGVRLIRALGHREVRCFHLNEGHASLLTLELLNEEAANGTAQTCADEISRVKTRCIFTTHTPVPAGHDQFPMTLVRQVLGEELGVLHLAELFAGSLSDCVARKSPGPLSPAEVFRPEHTLNLTLLALQLSHYVNGVAKRHAEVSRRLFGGYAIDDISNGVHAATWAAPAFRELFDRRIPGWRQDNFSLRYAQNLPPNEVWSAHLAAKQALAELVLARHGVVLDPAVLTLGCARRATPYKRADLILHDLARLKAIGARAGRLQLVCGGKAHPNDSGGKEIVQRLLRAADGLRPEIELVYLENYDLALAGLVVAGVDVWLNTPLPPMEASGTSGMKAAINGVPSLSILDGWWLEGCIEGATGWAIGALPEESPEPDRSARDADSLYTTLEHVVAPLFHQERRGFIRMMRHAIALNGSFFNTQRMVQQYVVKAYLD